jgi:lysozyme family protein
MSKLANILPLVLAHEGGFSDHPRDPGGATMKGVTQRVYDHYRELKGLEPRSVRHITTRELEEIYQKQYFDAVKGDQLPAGLDYAVFDYAVNSGPGRAAKDLQRTLGRGLKVDGQIGLGTLAVIREAMAEDEEGLIQKYCDRRLRFLRGLKTWDVFGKGWGRRVFGNHEGFQETDKGVVDYAIMMARKDLEFPIKVSELPVAIGVREGEEGGRGTEAETAVTKTPAGIGTIIAATGVSGQTIIAAAEQVKPHIGDTLVGKLALIAFLVMMLAGAGLLGYTFYRRMKEKGAI